MSLADRVEAYIRENDLDITSSTGHSRIVHTIRPACGATPRRSARSWPPSTERGSKAVKRAGIFLFFDPQGLVDDYIVECLTSLREYLDEILVVSNSALDDTARERLLKGATEVFEREKHRL